jgi:hypothetical protein
VKEKKMTTRQITDEGALDSIQEVLNGEWDADSAVGFISLIVEMTGREIKVPDGD